jgi:hypothetical protein
MKIILPSFTIGILTAATLLGQNERQQGEQSRGAPATARLGTTVGAIADSKTDAPATLSKGAALEGADLLVQKAADALAKHESVSTRVRYHAEVFGHRPIGQGIYLQQGLGAERKFRWELKASIRDNIFLWQQVCDGRYLWQLNEFSPDERNLNRIDLRHVRQALEQANQRPDKSLGLKIEFAIGGLPQLADNLRKSFRFTRAEAGQLDQLPVWIVTGSWRPEAIKPKTKESVEKAETGKPLDLTKLPPQLPAEVVVYFGQDDLFPYRIEYHRRGAGQGRGGQGGDDEIKPMLLLEFYEVQLNAPIDRRQFEYEPTPSFADTTEVFLKSLGVK